MKTKIIITALVLLVLILFIFSPYRYDKSVEKNTVTHSVEINSTVDSVFKFLGNSDNASKWSVFVDHIIPLNNDSFSDGKPGSRRRCFCNANEQGTQWDELITVVEPNKKRQLAIYNLQNFSMTTEGLVTEQLYEKLPNNRCKLTFSVFYLNHNPTIYETGKTYIAAYKMKSIFVDNMNNIKNSIESGN